MKIVVKRTSKKTLKICPQSDGSVTVVDYQFLSQKRIADYIAENITWINSCINKLAQSPIVTEKPKQDTTITRNSSIHLHSIDNQTLKDIFVGKSVLLCGQLYSCRSSTQNQTHISDDCLCISEKHFANKDLRLKAIASFLKRMSSSMLSQEISKVGSDLALCPTKIQFKDLHGRWCSCTDAESKAILLDYRLIQLPKQLQSFVIAHAFAHFLQQGHTTEFYSLLSKYVANHKECQKELAKYNFLLDV